MKSKLNNFIVFDLETTGLPHQNPAVVEIACVVVDIDMNTVAEFESGVMKMYGDKVITQSALDANGITVDQIENGVDPKVQAKKLIDFFAKFTKGKTFPILVGHNIDSFDIPLLDDYFTCFGYDLSKYVSSDTIDTLKWSWLRYVESTNYKLGTMCSENGVDLVNAHRALADTRANAELFKKYIGFLRGSGGENKSEEIRYRETFEF